MKLRPYEDYNAQSVLERLEQYIDRGVSVDMNKCYDDLSIFDWWPNRLNINHMKQMRSFLNLAIKNGYTGYVCFKVGASGCANGMWAYKNSTTDGYSPDGDALYRSFTPDYTYYAAEKDGRWYPGEDTDKRPYDCCKTQKHFFQ